MHPNPAFRKDPLEANLAFARERGFGILAVGGDGVPMLSHVPFLLAEDGTQADLHLVRSNPIARACSAPLPARIAISGPDSYVSPDWYGAEDQVPTWNYVAVHLTGVLEPLPRDALWDILDRQASLFEERLLPKPPWTSAKMSAGVMDRMLRAIAPFRLKIEAIDGTWKLNQNKPDDVRLRAAKAVAAFGQGQELGVLSALMQGVDSGD